MSDIGTALASITPISSSLPSSIEELELVGHIRNLFQKARAERRPLVAQWNRNYRIVRNRTWSGMRPSWLPSPEVPEIYPILASIVGWMTDQRPNFTVIPSAEPHSQYYEYFSRIAHDLQTTIHTSWVINRYDSHVEQVIWDALMYGTGVFKTGWDNTLVGGLGDAVMRRVDPYSFYPDPQAKSMLDANYFIEAKTMSIQEMDRRWPGSARKFDVEGYTQDIDEAPDIRSGGSMPRANPGAIPPAVSPSFGLPGQSRVHATDSIGVTVFEAWLRDHEVITEDDVTRVIDYWRVVIVAGNHVLMDEDARDIWEHGQHPYERYVLHETGEFWGLSMVEFLAPSQIAINRLLASLQLNIELTGNPIFKESTRAGIQRTKIVNKPGQRVTVNDNSTAEWLEPPQLNQLMPELIKFYIAEMERISGLSAISRGMMPGGRNSEGVIESLQESGFVRIRLGQRNLEWTLRDAGEKVASLIVENYTTPRMIAIVGPSAEKSSVELSSNHFYMPSEDGSIPMRFQLLVQAGSSLPTSRTARVAEADTLFAMGAIDEQAVLEAHDYPNRVEIATRVQTLKASGAMQPPGARQRTARTS